jgi:hypothetical protein
LKARIKGAHKRAEESEVETKVEEKIKNKFGRKILQRIYPLIGNGSVNTLPRHTLSTTELHPLLCNGPIKTRS